MIKTLYFKVKLISLFLQLNLGLKTRTKISISRKTQEIRDNIKLEKRPLTTQNNSTSTHKEHLRISHFCKYNDYFDGDVNIFCMMSSKNTNLFVPTYLVKKQRTVHCSATLSYYFSNCISCC